METFSALLAFCVGNSLVTGEFPAQRPVTRSFDVFFDLRLNKHFSKESSDWWFEMPSHSLWLHCNVKSLTVLSSSRQLFLCFQQLRSSQWNYLNITTSMKVLCHMNTKRNNVSIHIRQKQNSIINYNQELSGVIFKSIFIEEKCFWIQISLKGFPFLIRIQLAISQHWFR